MENKLIQTISISQWGSRKEDPTEFDNKNQTIRVRDDYDIENDPYGWIVHERVHEILSMNNFKDDDEPYPQNAVERMAYTWQFVYLIETHLAKTLEDVKVMMPWKFKRHGNEWAKKYWNYALSIAKPDDDPEMPPSIIYEGGRANPPWGEARFESVFRCLVEEAKAKRNIAGK